MRSIKRIAVIVFVAMLALTSCEKGKIDSVVLITVDGLTPEDAAYVEFVHKKAMVFDNAVTPCPVTLPAMATVMTGLHPLGHGLLGEDVWSLTDEALTLAEVFHTNGFRTAAFVGASNLGYETKIYQGFDKFDYDFKTVPAGPFAYDISVPADKLTKSALKWLGVFGDKPYFLWMHYGDLTESWAMPLDVAARQRNLDKLVVAIDELLSNLPRGGEGVLIILTAPAASARGAHGEVGHGLLLYDSTVRVPLDIAGPAIKPGTADVPVSLEDIAPTVVSLLNFPMFQTVQGKDLAPFLRGGVGPSDDRPRVLVNRNPYYKWGLSPLNGLVKNEYKLIKAMSDHVELYNIKTDPEERDDISRSSREAVDLLAKDLDSAEGLLKRLKAVARIFIEITDPAVDLPLPSSRIKALELYSRAAGLHRDDKDWEAYETLIKAMAIDPGNKRIAAAAAVAATESGKATKKVVIELWENAARLNPGDSIVLTSLGEVRYKYGDSAGALMDINKALEAEEANPSANMLAARIYIESAEQLTGEARKELYQKALKHLVAVIRVDDEDVEALFLIGKISLEIARNTAVTAKNLSGDEAQESLKEIMTYWRISGSYLEKAIEVDPKLAEAYYLLGALSSQMSKEKDARKYYEEYLKLEPNGKYAETARKALKAMK